MVGRLEWGMMLGMVWIDMGEVRMFSGNVCVGRCGVRL